jgi:hypothetical protein
MVFHHVSVGRARPDIKQIFRTADKFAGVSTGGGRGGCSGTLWLFLDIDLCCIQAVVILLQAMFLLHVSVGSGQQVIMVKSHTALNPAGVGTPIFFHISVPSFGVLHTCEASSAG